METQSVGQRFLALIQQLGMSKNAFALSLDKTATVIQHLVDERNKPGFDLMRKVFEVYPNVSKDWLLMGEGPMLLPGVSSPFSAGAAAPVAPLAAPVKPAEAPTPATPSFPTPLFAVSAARPPAPAVQAPLPAEVAAPSSYSAASPPAPAVEPAGAALELPELAVAAAASAASVPSPVAQPTGLDAAHLTAALHAQHLQHQLALAEQRNQHLLAEQKLILERQVLMQQMLDLLRRPV